MEINIARDYTKTPGGRYIKEGPFSGEDFRNTLLLPAFEKSKAQNERLTVVLDGGFGYAVSFLEEAFGGLVRQTKDKSVKDIEIISEEDESFKKKVYKYIDEAIKALK